MESQLINAYATRVVQANKSQLTVITYEIIIENISIAKNFLEQKDYKNFEKSNEEAQKFLRTLMESLDMQYKISFDLMSLYLFVNKALIESHISRKEEPLDHAIRVLNNLRVGFEGVSDQDNTPPLMGNTQQVYAGLTYGKGTLNEVSLDQIKRGFKA